MKNLRSALSMLLALMMLAMPILSTAEPVQNAGSFSLMFSNPIFDSNIGGEEAKLDLSGLSVLFEGSGTNDEALMNFSVLANDEPAFRTSIGVTTSEVQLLVDGLEKAFRVAVPDVAAALVELETQLQSSKADEAALEKFFADLISDPKAQSLVERFGALVESVKIEDHGKVADIKFLNSTGEANYMTAALTEENYRESFSMVMDALELLQEKLANVPGIPEEIVKADMSEVRKTFEDENFKASANYDIWTSDVGSGALNMEMTFNLAKGDEAPVPTNVYIGYDATAEGSFYGQILTTVEKETLEIDLITTPSEGVEGESTTMFSITGYNDETPEDQVEFGFTATYDPIAVEGGVHHGLYIAIGAKEDTVYLSFEGGRVDQDESFIATMTSESALMNAEAKLEYTGTVEDVDEGHVHTGKLTGSLVSGEENANLTMDIAMTDTKSVGETALELGDMPVIDLEKMTEAESEAIGAELMNVLFTSVSKLMEIPGVISLLSITESSTTTAAENAPAA